MISELHKYHDREGNEIEGILYKPENFNSNQKYPLIFNYYEQKSSELNQYESPEKLGGDIPIAWLVSNGYLVFKADIFSHPKEVGKGALNSVNAAADYLVKFNWVDSAKMAISGISFGGFETNYIVTHSNRFAAAISGAGVSNMITYYHDAIIDGEYTFIQENQSKMVSSLTEDKDLYIENSPIMFADKVTTPLLIMHNPGDERVLFKHGLSFFMELRGLKKKVWMLSYKDDFHGISDDNAIDYYTKVTQFFNSYLKNYPQPNWMNSPVSQ